MKHVLILSLFATLISCSQTAVQEPALSDGIYKSWVLSRCLSKLQTNKHLRQDALNASSAYLENSTLPVESFMNAEPLIDSFLQKDYRGSVSGSFNTKKCIDLFNSPQLDQLFDSEMVPTR